MSFNPEMRRRIEKAGAEMGLSQAHHSLAKRAFALSCSTLKDWNAVQSTGNGELGMESFSEDVQRVKGFDAISEADPIVLMKGLQRMEMAPRHIESVAEQCMNIFDKQRTPMSILNQAATTGNTAPMSTVVGRGMAAALMSQDGVGIEAFGEDVNRLSSDDRVTMTLTIMRPGESIMDKALARVSDASPIVTIKVPAPEVFNWATTQEANSTVSSRHAGATMARLRDLYRNPMPVNSAPKRMVIVDDATDTGDVLWNGTLTHFKVGKKVPFIDLTRTGSNYTHDQIDRTDLVSDGAVVDSVIVTIVSGANTNHFKLDTSTFEMAAFTPSASTKDSGQRQVILDGTFAISETSKQFNDAASPIAAALTDAKIQIDFRLNSTLNIKTSETQGSGTVEMKLVPLADGTPISGATTTLFNAMTITLSAYSVEAYFNEENMRKANVSIQTNYYEMQFPIPRGRVYFSDYSMNQDIDENNIATTSSVMALGNDRRGLDSVTSALNEIAAGQQFALANPEIATANGIGEQSFAASLVKPTVVTSVLDYEDEPLNVMNESTRLTEIHGRFRARVLSMATTLFAESLMINQYKAGEKPVIKCWAHSTLADLIIGIVDYYPELSDKAATASGADYSMLLPNGMRLDIIKTNYDCMIGRVYMVPVIESDMTNILSAAQIRDCGMVSTNYIPTISGASMRRFATTSREIVMMTNKCGMCLEVKGLQEQLGAIGHNKVELAPNSVTAIVL